MEKEKKDIHIKFRLKNKNKKTNFKWIFTITISTVLISFFLSLVSNILTVKLHIIYAVFILILIILIGIFTDILGIATTSADITPYNSMSANKIRGAREAIFLVKNASSVSNFFNDVIGDICGIISGSMVTLIVIKLMIDSSSIYAILLSSVVAGLTVGGKAIGKEFSIKYANRIVYSIGYIMSFFTRMK